MIRQCIDSDTTDIFEIINDAAAAYRGVIPADRWHVPYMSVEQVVQEIEDGIVFWGFEHDGHLAGIMGIQDKGDVTLIRHAYVLTRFRRQGIGAALLQHLECLTDNPVLIGTWRDASWAVAFYEKHGYQVVSEMEKDRLLRKYWSIPARQIETSVVLAKHKERTQNEQK